MDKTFYEVSKNFLTIPASISVILYGDKNNLDSLILYCTYYFVTNQPKNNNIKSSELSEIIEGIVKSRLSWEKKRFKRARNKAVSLGLLKEVSSIKNFSEQNYNINLPDYPQDPLTRPLPKNNPVILRKSQHPSIRRNLK